MKSNLFAIWKALRTSWVLLGKKAIVQKKKKENKIKTTKRVTSYRPALYLCRLYFTLYVFYCFDQPNCKCP